jgi:hypothetical protein
MTWSWPSFFIGAVVGIATLIRFACRVARKNGVPV